MKSEASRAPTSPDPRTAPESGEPRWQVRLLGAVEAHDGEQRIDRFPSRAVAALLARLALAPGRAHPREELVELLWPGVDLAVGRNRLRQALSTLKSLLEPAGVPGSAVLVADRLALRVAPGALGCDALTFEQAARGGRHDAAHRLYRGELMPGFYDEWIADERRRLAALHERLPAAVPPQQAVAASPSQPAAAAAAVAAPGTPLPQYLTRLFGAELAAARLRAQVLSRRLVTLLGPGGSGKTRLGVEVAQALRTPPPWRDDPSAAPGFDRIAFVPLVSCDERVPMLDAIARALQLPAAADGSDGVPRLVAALAGQRVLLVLDNFEQLVGRGEAALAELLAALPALHLLVTSRRALGLDGEVSVSTQPLALPAAGADIAAAAANPAVALFVDRARAARADFHLGLHNHAAVAALVCALGGMPLAIELAASRVRSFAPAEMTVLLGAEGAQLALLARTGPRGGHDPRHASMAEVIAWSWRLLDEPAQAVLAALALFPAAATAAAVAATAGVGVGVAALKLDELVQHSLARSDGGLTATPGAARFGLVEPVREFVLAERPPQPQQRQRQRAWLLAWARTRPGPAQVAPELALVHAVLAAADQAREDAVALALALRAYWDTDGLPATVQAMLAAALPACSDAGQRSDLAELLAYLCFEAGLAAQAREHAEAALAWAPDASRRARALVRRAWVRIAAGRTGQHDAGDEGGSLEALKASLAEALALARDCGDREAEARALHQCAVLASAHDRDHRRAEALLEASQTLWLALGDRRKAYARLRNRAQCWVELGREADAMAAYELCEQAARDDGDWVGQIDTLLSLATLLTRRREWAAALDVSRRGVALCWQRWHRHGLAYALWNPSLPLARLRRPEPAMRLMGFAATFWTRHFGPLSPVDRRELRRVRRLVRAQLGATRTETLWIEGAAMEIGAAVALALEA